MSATRHTFSFNLVALLATELFVLVLSRRLSAFQLGSRLPALSHFILDCLILGFHGKKVQQEFTIVTFYAVLTKVNLSVAAVTFSAGVTDSYHCCFVAALKQVDAS